MASVYSKGGVLYLTWYENDFGGDRKKRYQSLGLNDTRENKKIAKKIKEEKEFEQSRPNQKILKYRLILDDGIKLFMFKKKTSKTTIKNYNIVFSHFRTVVDGKILISKISKDDIEKYKYYLVEKREVKHNTVASYFRDLRTFWNWLVAEKYVLENIVDVVKAKEKPIVVIPKKRFDEILKIFSRNRKHYQFIMFLKLTGFRISEATNLFWNDIDFDNKRIKVTNVKGKREEYFPLYEKLEEFVVSMNNDGEKVFSFKNGDSLKFWSREMKKLGYPYSLHTIRKTFATELINGKVSVFDAMKLLRHKNITTTMKYYTYADISRIGSEANKIFSKE